ncbi:SusC/RagA family TonB-linked outer membrane protein [Wenyingzhuangia marina]|nr:SusC/RagA family TonB-linked outer membrane protein [Wenyingzhuangia marina]
MLLVFIATYQVHATEVNVTDVSEEIQKRTISGVVKDSQGMALPGANVSVEGTDNIVMTDFDGEFKLNIQDGDKTLVVSYLGFETEKVSIGTKSVFTIILNPSSEALDELVLVGFGTQKKESMVSSITTINPKELKGPTSNLTNMIAGRVGGVIAYQDSGEPGQDNSNFFVRGLGSFGSGPQNPLILIDGIESTTTDMARLQPDDIEDFSVLKDAAASAVYGARGANGVVLINTKGGKAGKTRFHLRTESRISSNSKNFNFADNITYMNLANEAFLTRILPGENVNGGAPPYTQNKIFRTSIGDDPLYYPNNNWIDELVKDYTVNQGYNLSASGGGEKAKYYISGTYNIDNGVLNVEGLNNFNSNIKLKNYSLRSNLDINLTPTTKASVNLYGQFDDYNGPIGGRDRNNNRVSGGKHIFNLALWSNPVAFPKKYPASFLPYIDHPLFGGEKVRGATNDIMTNPYAEMVKGYASSRASTIQTQVEIEQDLEFITKGLSFRTMGYIRRFGKFESAASYNPFYYASRIDPETGELSINVLNDGSEGSIGIPGRSYLNMLGEFEVKEFDSRIHLQTSFHYNRTFNEKHEVSGMLINLISNYETGNTSELQTSLPNRNHVLSGRFTYGYDARYLAEFNFGYNGSEKFASGNRYGFFPSIGLGYQMSNESYWEPLKDIITSFKIRGTYGRSGNDAIGERNDRFFYLSLVDLNSPRYGASFGEEATYYRNGVRTLRYANPEIAWETSEVLNVGFDLEIDKSLTFNADFFTRTTSNILEKRENIGTIVGLGRDDQGRPIQPRTNYGIGKTEGMEFALNYNKQFNSDWYTQLRGNFTYATSERVQTDELNYPDELSYRSKVGYSFRQEYGYIAERLFIDDFEVANSPTQSFNGIVRGGDIKYRDVNGDGQITENDKVPIGYPTLPEIIYGFGGTVGYKNFDFNIFFQGSARSSFFINPNDIAPFVASGTYQNGLLKVIADDHWSEANRDSYALWPRLNENMTWGREENNLQQSTWWMRDGSFIRLKTIEAGYNIPEKLLSKVAVTSARLYFSGNNIAVWSKFKLWDPEMGGNGLGYPIQTVYNLGLRVDF